MNSFGENFRITIFGASHAPVIGITIEGVPAGLQLDPADFTEDILRRKSGRKGTTPRIEKDIPIIESGVRKRDDGTMVTSGEPMTITFENKNIRPQDYASLKNIPRPGHADFTAYMKYSSHKGDFENTGFTGGGIFSGRMTLPLVGAGVVAKKIISPIEIRATLIEVGGIPIGNEEAVEALLEKTIEEGDSLGGIIECICTNIPAGLGEPFFNSVESLISHAIFSIPGIRGIEFGDGFSASRMKGSEHNDPFIDRYGHTAKNGAGGINGGISNGNPLVFRVAVKPTSSISKTQTTFDFAENVMTEISVSGRHDVCFALRVPPVVEAMTACVLADLYPFD
ncbi:MAG TPA: chorismate synthase [Bacteroidales bacterium]|jgi:chorismate synthase|nr:chorismate synthase [Bacteroidales bacterium]HPB89378.1 chorismate synthase [Bacteroidales bacterium]HPH52519.1 chorismate synthase [Bacteroidales bacterium]HPY21960.1 chorismate synthase [Bacteroidales bacterium]HQA92731.1 chorismate synthase [Bacteroidales bacterium]